MNRTRPTPSPPPAPGEERSVALALVNTRFQAEGRIVDAIGQPAEALAWLNRHQALPAEGARTERRSVDAETRLPVLREAIRALFVARIQGDRPPKGAVEELNAALRAVPSIATLSWAPSGPPTRGHRACSGDRLTQGLAALAMDALEVLTGPDATMLAACPASGCMRLMLRTHGKRQWCSTRCGDRVRAARHYQRTRVAPRR